MGLQQLLNLVRKGKRIPSGTSIEFNGTVISKSVKYHRMFDDTIEFKVGKRMVELEFRKEPGELFWAVNYSCAPVNLTIEVSNNYRQVGFALLEVPKGVKK